MARTKKVQAHPPVDDVSTGSELSDNTQVPPTSPSINSSSQLQPKSTKEPSKDPTDDALPSVSPLQSSTSPQLDVLLKELEAIEINDSESTNESVDDDSIKEIFNFKDPADKMGNAEEKSRRK
jgi:hypothetical protein